MCITKSLHPRIALVALVDAIWSSSEMDEEEAQHVSYMISVLGQENIYDLISGRLVLYKTATPGVWSFALPTALECTKGDK